MKAEKVETNVLRIFNEINIKLKRDSKEQKVDIDIFLSQTLFVARLWSVVTHFPRNGAANRPSA
jgi:hypothetical protein